VQTILYVCGLAFYNIYLHPLRSYPGPKLWCAFRLPHVYHQLNGDLTLRVKELHEQYGSIVRINPNELSYVTASAWKEIYGFRKGQSQNPKDKLVLPAPQEGKAVNIILANDAEHSRVRRLISHAFSAKALEDQQPLIVSYVDLLIQRLTENAARPQDMVAWYNWIAFDLIGDLAFGESFHGVRDQHWHPWVQTILGGLLAGSAISCAQRYGLGTLLTFSIPKAMMEKYEQMFAYTKDQVGKRLERGTERPDFMSFIMRNDKEGNQMSRAEMEATAEVLVVAGSETTASLLSGVTYYLCTYPEILKKVTAEVRNAFDSDDDMDINSINRLEYMLAVLHEGLRIYPPAPSALPRVIMNGDTVSGRWVPPGVSNFGPLMLITSSFSNARMQTTVGVYQFAAHHYSKNFYEPESFRPERWLPNPPAEFTNDNREAVQPFSTGPRNCIGKKYVNSSLQNCPW
jgi:cytochrome P450